MAVLEPLRHGLKADRWSYHRALQNYSNAEPERRKISCRLGFVDSFTDLIRRTCASCTYSYFSLIALSCRLPPPLLLPPFVHCIILRVLAARSRGSGVSTMYVSRKKLQHVTNCKSFLSPSGVGTTLRQQQLTARTPLHALASPSKRFLFAPSVCKVS